MTDRVLFELAEGWRLAYDSQQWIIERRKGHTKDGQEKWRGVRFIGGHVDDLYRCLARLKIDATDEAVEKLTRLPTTFKAFQVQQVMNRTGVDIRTRKQTTKRPELGPTAAGNVAHSDETEKSDPMSTAAAQKPARLKT